MDISCGLRRKLLTKNHKKILLPILILVIALSFCIPAKADTINNYYDRTPDEVYGTWSTLYNRAAETAYGSYYKCTLVFVYTGVTQSADDYMIYLDFDSSSPGWPYTESLKMEYRWSNVETWTFLAYLDVYAFDDSIDITSATSSILYLRFTDCAPTDVGAANIWYFGDEPYLSAYTL